MYMNKKLGGWKTLEGASQQCTLYIHTKIYLSILQKNKNKKQTMFVSMNGPKGVCHNHCNIHC